MNKTIIEATTDVKRNILMAADFLEEQKRSLNKKVAHVNNPGQPG